MAKLDPQALISAGAISGVDISPDGTAVVFASSAGGRPKIYIRELQENGHTRLVDTGAESATQPKWSPRGDVIAFLQDVGGDENYRICLVPSAGGQVVDLTQRPGMLHENYAWSADGARIAFVSNRDGQFDVYYVDVDSRHVHRVTNYPSVHHSPEFSPDGSEIAYCSNRTELRGNWDTFVTSLADGIERKVTQHEGEADEMSYYAGQRPLWSPDGSRILVSSSIQGSYDIMAVDVNTLDREWLVVGPRDEINAQWSPDGTRLGFVRNVDGNLCINCKDLSSSRRVHSQSDYSSNPAISENDSLLLSQASGSSGVIGMRGKGADYRWSSDGNSIVYGHLSATEPGSVWTASVDGAAPSLLYSSLPEGLDRSALTAPEVVRYTSFDGLQISGLLFKPVSRRSIGPAILLPHGGPTGQSTNVWSPLIQYVVSAGYVVLEPNFRGSTGYGRDFQWLNHNDWGGGDLSDVVAGADWLQHQGIASCVGIMGGSYGGFMALSAATQYPGRWKAVVSMFGIANLVTMYTTARSDMRHFQERNIGTPEENPQLYFDRSPLNHVDRITAPILILQGDRDARVPLIEAEQIRDGLQRENKEFEYVVYKDEGHGFAKLDTKLDYLQRICRFFQKHMPAEGAIDP